MNLWAKTYRLFSGFLLGLLFLGLANSMAQLTGYQFRQAITMQAAQVHGPPPDVLAEYLNLADINSTNEERKAPAMATIPAPSGFQPCTDYTGVWRGAGNTWTATTFSGVGVTITLQADPGAAWNPRASDYMNTIDAWSERGVQGYNSFDASFIWDTDAEGSYTPAADDASTGTITIGFDRPVLNPVLHIDRLGGIGGGNPNSSEWTLVTPGASMTRLAGVDHFVAEPQRFFRSLTGEETSGSQSSFDTSKGTAAGSVGFGGVFTKLTFRLTGIGLEGVGADGVELVMCANNSSFDFGDLPAPYLSTVADRGPSHEMTGAASHYLGAAPDAENDAQPTTAADGDDSNDSADEDGVTLPAMSRGGNYIITADATGDGGYLQGWIDWNGDGDFEDTVDGESERIATDLPDGDSDGTIEVPVTVPASATFAQTYARFRWSTVQGLDETTPARDGEVEDYSVTLSPALSGTVYSDANHSGTRESGEGGIPGVTIILYNTEAGSCRSALTDGGGQYRFEEVVNGDYKIIEAVGESISGPGSCPAGEADPGGHVSTTSNTLAAYVKGAPVTEQNFGDFEGSKLSGTVFKDTGDGAGTANDGTPNGEEAGIAQAIIKLTDSGGPTIHSQTQTSGDGRYTLWIPEALSGSPLRVEETNVDNYVSTGGEAGNTGGSYDRNADATTFTPASGSNYTDVTFGDVPNSSLNTDGQQQTTPGTTVFFPHTFTGRTDGAISFRTSTQANPVHPGWTQIIYRDNNCNGAIDGVDAPVTNPAAVTRGEKICLIIRAHTPKGIAVGASNTITVSADIAYSNAVPALSNSYTRTDRVNITDASGSGLKLVKEVDRTEALPGETLIYTIVYINNGSAPLNDLEIDDSTPAFTTFGSAGCGTLPNNITNCTIAAPSVGTEGSITWSFTGRLQPGTTGKVMYEVTIQE